MGHRPSQMNDASESLSPAATLPMFMVHMSKQSEPTAAAADGLGGCPQSALQGGKEAVGKAGGCRPLQRAT